MYEKPEVTLRYPLGGRERWGAVVGVSVNVEPRGQCQFSLDHYLVF